MEKSIKLTSCLAALLLCTMSCSKDHVLGTGSAEQGSEKNTAHSSVSTTVSYNKTTAPLVTVIPAGGSTPNVKKVLYSIGPLNSLQVGDVISAHLQQQLGSTTTIFPSVATCGIVVTTSASSTDGILGMLSKFTGSNLTEDATPWEVYQRTGSYQLKSGDPTSGIYVNAVFYAAAGNGDYTVPAGAYGEMVAVVERGVSHFSVPSPYTYNLSNYNDQNGISHPGVPIDGPALHNQYALGVGNIAAGTIADVRYLVEGTAELTITTPGQRLGRSIVQSTGGASTTGTTITRQIQGGIKAREHHHVWSHAGGKYYSSPVSNAYFNTSLYCYGGGGYPMFVYQENGSSYGGFVVETRPGVASDFNESTVRRVSTVTSGAQVAYVVGPIDIAVNQVVEIRYQSAFAPGTTSGWTSSVTSKIVRGNSYTGITDVAGTLIQPPLVHRFVDLDVYDNIVSSTADKNTTGAPLTNQYYKVIVTKVAGSDLPILDWGELEVVKRPL